MSVEIRPVTAQEFPSLVPTLVQLLIETVAGGAALGFLPPVEPADARHYWLSLTPELWAGSRLLVGAFCDGRIIGSGQLVLPSLPNARHRAELQKLFLSRAFRGRDIGQRLLVALHDAARRHGRWLVILHARRPVADRFYKPLGYQEVGVVPGYSLGTSGEDIDSVALYLDLRATEASRSLPRRTPAARSESERSSQT
jgi:GNAT superfamily N-acetyltransferase